ncbi:replication endonuclease [Burkholderia lata]|uniref:replication endonuclease n=1 Tax=Burkholderia lata (strain ATCC 17760 / DSM 23089 / LMG 22485 / NCIMB 9086 / R18194 / 383) TaxID=482957 RepID=UPI00399A8C80
MRRTNNDHEWANELVADLPRPWAMRLLSQWERRRTSFNRSKVTAEGTVRRAANEALRDSVAPLQPACPQLPLAAADHEVCDAAWNAADACRTKLIQLERDQRRGKFDFGVLRAAGLTEAQAAGADVFEQRVALSSICAEYNIEPPDKTYEDGPAVRRMVAAKWWKGRLRKAHGMAKESAAIVLGLVAKDRECYVSNVSVRDRKEQNDRNAAALDATIARNIETDQEFTLAQLAAKGTANKAIRRAELMTRINGFERIAIAAGDAGLFGTFTCPSRMHRMTTVYGRPRANSKWDGTTPREAQVHLRKTWARIRASLARKGICIYGFRIAEPQHDGTPHWHCLLFYPKEHDTTVRSTIRRYALAVDGDERGAQEKRVDLKRMDPAKGTAAGYIAKYVAKNIDGYRLEKDLHGNDSFETSERVEAWATRWRIRQFQQIGGPPVSVWRELRRVEAVPSDAPKFVQLAHNAVNKVAVYEGRENASVAWDHYVEAQGGVACGRDYRVRMAKIENEQPNQYGEDGAPRIVGIEYFEEAKVRDALGNWIDVMPRTVTVPSKRYTWEITRASRSAAAKVTGTFDIAIAQGGYAERGVDGIEIPDLILTGDEYAQWAAEHPAAAADWESGLEHAQRAPWTRVNNCTRSDRSGVADPTDRAARGSGNSVSGGVSDAKRGQRNL